MINAFDTDVALDVGVYAAIIYKNIQYWCEYNRTNEQNEFNGYYWTYNSVKAFTEQFPYLTSKQVRVALDDLEEKGYILSGNYNKSAYDRTKWYTDARTEKVKTACPISQIDLPYMANENALEGKPIPNNNTNNNTNNNSKEKSKREKPITKESFDDVLNSYELIRNNVELKAAFLDFIAMRRSIKKPLATTRALKLNINEAMKLGNNDPTTVLAIVNQSIANSWQGFYALKNKEPAQTDDYFEKLLAEMEAESDNETGNTSQGITSISDTLPLIL